MSGWRADGRVSTSLARSQAVRVGPGTGKAEAIEARPHDFAPLFPPAAIPLELSSRYSGAVLASGPWGYWRFEDDTDTVFRNEIAGGPVIRATGDIARRAAPGSNHWLVFPGEGKDAGTHALMDDVWPRSRDPRYAIELWFDAENFANSTLVALLGTEKPLPHNNHLGVIEMRANRQEPGGIRFLHRWPAGPDRGVNISSHQIYFPCRWTHLVAQCDGSRLQLILDGVPVAESPLPPDLASGPCHVLLGRLVQPSFEPTKSELFRLFRGGLDELALYDRPLSLEEIKTHIQAR